jgi:hypothetical protein
VQPEPSIIVTRMNRAYNAVYGTHSPETRRNAEQTFYRCQDWLRQRGITFHQALDGNWVLDYEGGQYGK